MKREPSAHGTTSSRSSSIVAGPIRSSLELLDGTESPVSRAVVEDLLRGDRTDAGEGVQLLERRRAQADRPRRRARSRHASRGDTACDLARYEHLLPVGERRREVQRLEKRLRRRAAGALDRIGDTRAVGKPIEPRPTHCTGDVHDELGPDGRSRVAPDGRSRGGGRGRLGAV